MPRLSRIIWYGLILILISTTVVFSFGLIMIGAAIASLYAIYKYYFGKKRSQSFKQQPPNYMFGEVVDIKGVVVDDSLEKLSFKK